VQALNVKILANALKAEDKLNNFRLKLLKYSMKSKILTKIFDPRKNFERKGYEI